MTKGLDQIKAEVSLFEMEEKKATPTLLWLGK